VNFINNRIVGNSLVCCILRNIEHARRRYQDFKLALAENVAFGAILGQRNLELNQATAGKKRFMPEPATAISDVFTQFLKPLVARGGSAEALTVVGETELYFARVCFQFEVYGTRGKKVLLDPLGPG